MNFTRVFLRTATFDDGFKTGETRGLTTEVVSLHIVIDSVYKLIDTLTTREGWTVVPDTSLLEVERHV